MFQGAVTLRVPEAHIVRKKRYGQAAAERDEIRDLMVIRCNPVTPRLRRLQVVRIPNDDGLDKIPFDSGLIDLVFLGGRAAGEDVCLHFRNNSHRASTLACVNADLTSQIRRWNVHSTPRAAMLEKCCIRPQKSAPGLGPRPTLVGFASA